MLVATVLASVLIGGVLTATAALSRDRRRMEAAEAGEQSTAPADLVRHDLANATALVGSPSATGFTLVGHGGIDAKSFAPDGRLCRVDYRVRAGVLSRHQSYLDDPIRPDPWAEVVAVGVRQIALTPVSADGERVRLSEDLEGRLTSRTTGQPLAATRVPSRLRLRIETGTGVTDKELVLR